MNRTTVAIVLAAAALLVTPQVLAAAQVAGVWQGRYYYPSGDGRPPVEFTATIQQNGDSISGRMEEPNTFGDNSSSRLYASLTGMVTSAGMLQFNKRYDGTAGVGHGVAYAGRISGNQVSGNWVIDADFSGRFEMTLVQPAVQQGCLMPGQPRTDGTFYIIPFGNRCDRPVQVAVCGISAAGRVVYGAVVPARGGADLTLGNVPPLLSTPWSETDMNPCD